MKVLRPLGSQSLTGSGDPWGPGRHTEAIAQPADRLGGVRTPGVPVTASLVPYTSLPLILSGKKGEAGGLVPTPVSTA